MGILSKGIHSLAMHFLATQSLGGHVLSKPQGMNFSANADPEPELLLAILRHISLIEHKKESRRPLAAKTHPFFIFNLTLIDM